jgi:serine/threonine protein kinase
LSQGFLFVDVKPENFMMKVVPSGEEKLRFIDFGLMEKYTQYTSGGAQRERGSRAAVAGTHLYASLAVLRGEVPSRRDDVEAMVCTIYKHAL